MTTEAPVRLCCMNRHYGPQCPDGLVMCCLCFERWHVEQLAVDEHWTRVDVCGACAAKDAELTAVALREARERIKELEAR